MGAEVSTTHELPSSESLVPAPHTIPVVVGTGFRIVGGGGIMVVMVGTTVETVGAVIGEGVGETAGAGCGVTVEMGGCMLVEMGVFGIHTVTFAVIPVGHAA